MPGIEWRGRTELTSWKEIAEFLEVSVRTAQRWESDGGLPVRRLGGDRMEAGEHRVDWDGRDQGGRSLDAGMYFYRLNVDGRSTEARKAIRLGP